ncbi:MAG: hypothetical protein P4L16_07530 [Chlamydiales bacterium]|nr:hypothetical protein [Chlamydiales bacterium]
MHYSLLAILCITFSSLLAQTIPEQTNQVQIPRETLLQMDTELIEIQRRLDTMQTQLSRIQSLLEHVAKVNEWFEQPAAPIAPESSSD